MESESSNIGRVQVPPLLFEEMRKAPRFEVCMPMPARVSATLEEYRDLTLDANKLKGLLKPLEKHAGKDVFAAWLTAIEQERWGDFVEELLVTHYDPTYFRSQTRHA